MTAMTITEKVMARAAGRERVVPGEGLNAEPDLVVLYEWFGLSDWFFDVPETELDLVGLPYPEKMLFFIDHLVPVQNEAHWHLYSKTRSWCRKHGIRCIEGEGSILSKARRRDEDVRPGLIGTRAAETSGLVWEL